MVSSLFRFFFERGGGWKRNGNVTYLFLLAKILQNLLTNMVITDLFATPDLSASLDRALFVIAVLFTVLAGSANLVHIPFLHRSGGLLSVRSRFRRVLDASKESPASSVYSHKPVQ